MLRLNGVQEVARLDSVHSSMSARPELLPAIRFRFVRLGQPLKLPDMQLDNPRPDSTPYEVSLHELLRRRGRILSYDNPTQ